MASFRSQDPARSPGYADNWPIPIKNPLNRDRVRRRQAYSARGAMLRPLRTTHGPQSRTPIPPAVGAARPMADPRIQGQRRPLEPKPPAPRPPSAPGGERLDDPQRRPRHPGEDELGDAVPRPDLQRLCPGGAAVPHRQHQRSLVVGVDHPDRVAEHEAAMAEARAGDRPGRTSRDRGSPPRSRPGSAPAPPAARARGARPGRHAGRARRRAPSPSAEIPAPESGVEDAQVDGEAASPVTGAVPERGGRSWSVVPRRSRSYAPAGGPMARAPLSRPAEARTPGCGRTSRYAPPSRPRPPPAGAPAGRRGCGRARPRPRRGGRRWRSDSAQNRTERPCRLPERRQAPRCATPARWRRGSAVAVQHRVEGLRVGGAASSSASRAATSSSAMRPAARAAQAGSTRRRTAIRSANSSIESGCTSTPLRGRIRTSPRASAGAAPC